MPDKRMTEDDVVAELRDGMTIGIGGWGSRRKPMSIVRAILRSRVRDLTVVSYGGPDVGLLCAAEKARKVVFGFVSLDSIPLEPHFRRARETGRIEAMELDEGMMRWGLTAAANRVSFLPIRAGFGSDVLLAAERRFMSCERIVATEDLLKEGSVHTLRINRSMTDGVVEAPGGAHFTSCEPDYSRDESFQRAYAEAAADEDSWTAFRARYLDGESEDAYRAAIREGS